MLDKSFGGVDYDEPTTVYVGICTACNRSGTITGEPTIGVSAYARIELDNDATTWASAASGALVSIIDIQFERATGDWGSGFDTIFLSDAASGNTNTLVYGSITSLTIEDGDQVIFPSGDFSITL